MARDNRVTLTIKLHPDKDADLVAWVNSLPKGDYSGGEASRQAIYKAAIRAALDLPTPAPATDPALDQLTAEFSAALEDERQRRAVVEDEVRRMQAITASLPQIVKQLAGTNAPAQADAARLADLETQIAALMSWANDVHARIESGLVSASAPAGNMLTIPQDAAPMVEDGLTEAEQQQRARKLKKAKW